MRPTIHQGVVEKLEAGVRAGYFIRTGNCLYKVGLPIREPQRRPPREQTRQQAANKSLLSSVKFPYLIACGDGYVETNTAVEVKFMREVGRHCGGRSFERCVRALKALKTARGWHLPGVALEYPCAHVALGHDDVFRGDGDVPHEAQGWKRGPGALEANLRACLLQVKAGVDERTVVHKFNGSNVLEDCKRADLVATSRDLKALLAMPHDQLVKKVAAASRRA
jgi:hypothetical protein